MSISSGIFGKINECGNFYIDATKKINEWVYNKYDIAKKWMILTDQNKRDIHSLFIAAGSAVLFVKSMTAKTFDSHIITSQNENTPARLAFLTLMITSIFFNSVVPRIPKILLPLIIFASNINVGKKKGILLYLDAKDPKHENIYKSINYKQFYELSKDFVIKHEIVGNVKEVVNVIEKISQSKLSIKVLVIAGHGNSEGIDLDENEIISGYEKILKKGFDMLDLKALIILYCCSTVNKKRTHATSVAERLATLANKRKVIAANEDLTDITNERDDFNVHTKSSFLIKRTPKDAESPLFVTFLRYNELTNKHDKNITVVLKRI